MKSAVNERNKKRNVNQQDGTRALAKRGLLTKHIVLKKDRIAKPSYLSGYKSTEE
jgi:hypothetical protein